MPLSLCSEIEGMINRFYWGGDVTRRKMSWMRWDKLARPKDKGGLGFRSFQAFNTSLLAKQWWRLMTAKHSLMARVMKACYYRHVPLMAAKKGSRPSYS